MVAKNSYFEFLKQDLRGLIESPQLSDLQKHLLRSRWLDQVKEREMDKSIGGR